MAQGAIMATVEMDDVIVRHYDARCPMNPHHREVAEERHLTLTGDGGRSLWEVLRDSDFLPGDVVRLVKVQL